MHQLAPKRKSVYDPQGTVARAEGEPHTDAMLGLAWILFGVEFLLALFFGVIFWHFWTHSAMSRTVAVRAMLIYTSGCIAFLLFTLFLPI